MCVSRATGAAGFTLVELLIASAILVVLGVAGYTGLDIVLGTADRVEQQGERLDRVQRTFTRLAMDVEQAVARPVRDDFGDTQAAMVYDSGLGTLEFTRDGLPNPAGWARSSLQRVAWGMERARLLRTYWPELDRLQGAQPVRRVLLDEVEALAFRFLDERQEWQDQWPPLTSGTSQPRALPRAIELTLRLRDWGELRRVYALPH